MTDSSIPDAPPAGYVPLFTAFDRFCELRKAGADGKREIGKRETEAEWAARQSADAKLCDDFLQALRCGRLKAIVCHPFTREHMPIPSEAWVTASLPTLPLWARVISGREGDGFLAYAGRTPFISEDQLLATFGVGRKTPSKPPTPRPQERYPWAECLAAFDRRVQQDGAPTTDGGETGWRTQADVEGWICDWMLNRCGTQPSEATARRHAKKFITHITKGS
jgi:hypothetical protein